MKTPRKALEAYWDLPADLEVVGAARRLVREVLVAWGISAVAEDVTMVVSELVSNAVVHGKAPITLSLHRHGRIVCGEVTDHSIVWPSPLPAGPDSEHGRGLAIVTAYADRWGVESAPEGKTVWFVCVEPGSR
ncbi:ATP-binding protein [Streptosporangium sp. NBC_01469]|uniref:ATP-binding protein n=1 Tax=Streptosporangium sp. NBC_01469 TaxID=2903898 RepID=UPI002E2DBEE2|nr:ATP-binding protein [Streptosporangium sp. NBC_01469]